MHRVLEVEHAELARGCITGLQRQHEVARHEVAVHVDLWRREVVRDDGVEGLLQCLRLRGIEREAFVLRQVPVGKELQLAAQQGVVVGRQHTGFGGQLPGQQRVQRLHVARVVGLRPLGVDAVEHGLVAEVAQQHEALRFVPSQDLGHQQAGLAQQTGHVHEGLAVLLRRWRVHHDQAAAGLRVQAQVAAKARVGRGGAQGAGQQAQAGGQRLYPGVKGGFPNRIGPGDGGVGRAHGGGWWDVGGRATCPGVGQWIIALDSTNPLHRGDWPPARSGSRTTEFHP